MLHPLDSLCLYQWHLTRYMEPGSLWEVLLYTLLPPTRYQKKQMQGSKNIKKH